MKVFVDCCSSFAMCCVLFCCSLFVVVDWLLLVVCPFCVVWFSSRVVCCLLCVVCCVWFVVSCLLLVVRCSVVIVCLRLRVDRRYTFVVFGLLFKLCPSVCDLCWLLSVVC